MELFVAIALLLQTSSQVAEPQPQGQISGAAGAELASPAQTATATAEQTPIDRVLICRERRRAGTRVAVTECYSSAVANQRADVARETMEEMLAGAGHNNSVR